MPSFNKRIYVICFPIAILLALSSCGPKNETITEKNAQGKVIKEYSVDKKTKQIEGEMKVYDDNGVLTETATYHQNKLNGPRTIYFASGKKKTVENYHEGQFQGPYTTFYESGQLNQQGQYISGAMQGEWKLYYENGKLKESVIFKDNDENGPFKEYYTNGNLKTEGNYLNGDTEDGELKLYDTLGKIHKIMHCEGGLCKTVQKFETKDTLP